jgi:hypothetical protein
VTFTARVSVAPTDVSAWPSAFTASRCGAKSCTWKSTVPTASCTPSTIRLAVHFPLGALDGRTTSWPNAPAGVWVKA